MSSARLSLRSLDALRGLLAVYVLLGHCRWLLWAGHAEWLRRPHESWEIPIAFGSAAFRYGHEAVMVFFVLSGFFIHLQAAAQLRGGGAAPLAAGQFYARRAHRLLAPYLFALLVTVVCDAIGAAWFPRLYAASTGDALLDRSFALHGYGWDSVIPALLLLPSSLGRDFGSNGPLWSLGFEVVYYLLYPAWFALRRRSRLLAFGVVPVIGMATAFIPGVSFVTVVLIHYPVWLAGAGLAELLTAVQSSRKMALSAAGLSAAGGLLYVSSSTLIMSAGAAVLFGTGIVMAFVLVPEPAQRFWLFRALEYLGMRSYTIYIVHFPFVALIGAWLIQTRGARPLHGWFALTGAILAVAFGCACFALCERHFLHPRLRMRPVAA